MLLRHIADSDCNDKYELCSFSQCVCLFLFTHDILKASGQSSQTHCKHGIYHKCLIVLRSLLINRRFISEFMFCLVMPLQLVGQGTQSRSEWLYFTTRYSSNILFMTVLSSYNTKWPNFIWKKKVNTHTTLRSLKTGFIIFNCIHILSC